MRNLTERIDMALGRCKAALVIKNARIFHLTDGSFEVADIAIDREGVIAAIGTGYAGERELDATGLTAVPGFIDTHLHTESSLMTPHEFERCALQYGVTTIACDPHELANVIGTAAFDYLFAYAERLTMGIMVRFSSCVPATSLETSGAVISAKELRHWHQLHPEAFLGEFMNVPGVLYKDPEVLEKLSLFDNIDGHCPLLSGKELNAYLSVGVCNCHETSLLEEGREKLRRGMRLFIREGSAARNLNTLMPLMTLENSPFITFCTDDRNPLDLQELGYLDRMIAHVIAAGVPPLVAYRIASWSGAQALQLHDRGLIAPGKRADIVLLSDLKSCTIEKVIVHGHLANEIDYPKGFMPSPDAFRNSIKCREMTPEDFLARKASGGPLPVIGIRDGDLVTDYLNLPPDAEDVLSLAVIERHGKNGNIGKGFVHGFGLKQGAIASSVGHDSHNICVVGTNQADMATAVNALREMQGGFIAVRDGQALGSVPLPLAGLFSDQPAKTIAKQLQELRRAVQECGCLLKEPFMQMAFIPLPVIPHLKLTDFGLVDVDKFQLIK